MSTPGFHCVVDASVVAQVYVQESLSAQAVALLALLVLSINEFHVPELIYAECANILWKKVQRKVCTPAEVAGHMAAVVKLPLTPAPLKDLAADALPIALANSVSAYDACYVALSRRHNVPLITGDQKLVAKLPGAQPPVIWLGNWTPPAPTSATPAAGS